MEEFDMKVTGIIAEYNPFHRGHAYHIEQAKKLTGADAVVVVMSGDFTQRGTPAIMDKYARARMALMNGADVVIELPSCYACASADTDTVPLRSLSLLPLYRQADALHFPLWNGTALQ